MSTSNLSEAIELLKPKLQEYLADKGIKKKLFKCLNPDHEDKHPSMNFIPNSNTVYCFSCHAKYDIINLMGIEMGLGAELQGKNFIEAVKYGCNKYGIPFEYGHEWNPQEYIKQCHRRAFKTTYFKKRNLSSHTIKKFKLGFDPSYPLDNEFPAKGKTMEAIIIPTSNYTYTARNTDPESEIRFRRSSGITNMFNIDALESELPVFVTEGEIDALTILDIGPKCVALSGTSNIEKFAEACRKANFKSTILIALDNDNPGKKHAEKLKELLDEYHIRNKILNIYGKYKDANEYYCKESNQFSLIVGRELKSAIQEDKHEKTCENIKKDCLELTEEELLEIEEIINKIKKKK